MNNIERLEDKISEIIVTHIEENPHLDKLAKEFLMSKISSLYDITGDMKEEREENYKKLREVMNNL